MYQKYTIGRNPDNNIIVPHPSVSGYHADLIYNDMMGVPQFTFIDHSTNGTIINGQWVKNASFMVGINDTILLAGCVKFDWSVFGYQTGPDQTYIGPFGQNPGAAVGRQDSNALSRTNPEISFVGALRSFFNKYVDFSGRATRREYWFMYLWKLIFSAILYFMTMLLSFSTVGFGMASLLELDELNLAAFISSLSGLGWILMVYAIYDMVMLIPSLALLVRRIHDTGKDGLWILMLLVPFVNIIFFFIWTLSPSEPHSNKWGL